MYEHYNFRLTWGGYHGYNCCRCKKETINNESKSPFYERVQTKLLSKFSNRVIPIMGFVYLAVNKYEEN